MIIPLIKKIDNYLLKIFINKMDNDIEVISIPTVNIYGFIKSFLIYSSHLSPIVKNKEKVKFYTTLKDLKMEFNPENYQHLNDMIEIESISKILLNFESISRDKLITEILIMEEFYYNGNIQNYLFDKENISINDKTYSFNHLLLDKVFYLVKSITFGISPELLPIIMKNGINPRVVNNFVDCPIVLEIDSLKKNLKERLLLIDRRNSEIVSLKKKNKEIEQELLNIRKSRNEISEKMINKELDIENLKSEIKTLKDVIDVKETRKQSLYEVRRRLKVILENPESKTLDDFYKLQEEHKQLCEEIPCCAILKEPLHELSKNGSELRITKCGHVFDSASLKNWLGMKMSNKLCPTCKNEIKFNETYQVYI